MKQSTNTGAQQPSSEGGTTPTGRSPVIILREALQHALDELHRVNASHACVRPDVTYAAMEALRKTFLAPIEHASEIEQRIVGKLVTDLLAADFSLSIWNGGDEAELDRSTDTVAIFKALAASDQDEIIVRKNKLNAGWILLVWGNDAAVISDYSIKLEDQLAGANALAEELDR